MRFVDGSLYKLRNSKYTTFVHRPGVKIYEMSAVLFIVVTLYNHFAFVELRPLPINSEITTRRTIYIKKTLLALPKIVNLFIIERFGRLTKRTKIGPIYTNLSNLLQRNIFYKFHPRAMPIKEELIELLPFNPFISCLGFRQPVT